MFSTASRKPQAQQQPAYTGLDIQTSANGKVIPLVFGTTRLAPNMIWYGDFYSVAHTSSQTGGKGGGVAITTTNYTYGVYFAMALCEGPIQGIGAVYVDKSVQTLASVEADGGFSLYTGTYLQSPWAYLTSYHPGEALNYRGTAYITAAPYFLGSNPNLTNHNFEVKGFFSNSVAGKLDADPSLVVPAILGNAHYGIGFTRVGDLTTYQDYTLSAGLLVSFGLTEQSTAGDVLSALAKATNSEFVWSEGVLDLVPYGDEAISGNGHSYTPPDTPLYDLDDDDFIAGDDPVLLTRKRPSDAHNALQLEYDNRANNYATDVVEAKDQAAIDLYGLRSTTTSMHLFADANAARVSVQLQLQREAVRNVYTFTTDQRYILLDPMDIITLTDPGLGLDRQWVRIIDIEENEDFTLTFTAEEYLNGTGHAPAYSFQENSGYGVDYNVSPGDANAPVIFDAPVQLATSGLEVWMAVSGGENWGGADIHISSDGYTYKYAGRIIGGSRQGLLSASLASGSDPDTTHTLSVDLSQSGGTLLSGTREDADFGHTLCYVDGELIAYQDAELTAENEYDLTYLRRGMYGTVIGSHDADSQFARLDGTQFIYPYDKSQIGQTIYVKLASFNIYGGAKQSLADVNPYTHLIDGPPLPPDVTNFTAQQNGGAVVFRWAEVNDYALKGYDILYGPQGSDLSGAAFLTESARGTEMTNASVPPGDWVFFIRARDIADQFSENATMFNLTVTNQNAIIEQSPQAPEWSGDMSGFYKHWTGKLVPLSQNTADAYVVLDPPDVPDLSSVTGGTIAATTYTVKTTYVTASGETLASDEETIDVPANALLSVTSPPESGEAYGWNVYVGTSPGTETRQNAETILIGAAWTEPTTGLIAGASPPSMNTTGWEVFNVFVPDPVSQAVYTTGEIDTGFDSEFRVWADRLVQIGPGDSGIPNVRFGLDAWKEGETDPGLYTDFALGFITARYLKARLTLDITRRQVPYVSAFTPTVDIEPTTETRTGVSVPDTGLSFTYSKRYHTLPNVQVTATSAGVTSGVAVDETTTGCTIYLYNGTDAVSGTCNITITGE